MSDLVKLSSREYTYISLFCGCGGFDSGFDKAGFICKGAYDNDKNVLDVYKKNLKGPAFLHDLSNHTIPGDLEPGMVDVILSGSPCQGFSTAGLRDVNDPRNRLLLVGGALVKKLHPKVFIAENVMGSLSGTHKQYWQQLEQLLLTEKYNIRFLTIDASNLGLAQSRKRVIMIAWQGNDKINFKLSEKPKASLMDSIKDVKGLPNSESYIAIKDQKVFKLIQHIKPGQKLCNVRGGERSVYTWSIPEVFGAVSKEEENVLLLLKDLRRKLRTRNYGDADPIGVEILREKTNFPIQPILDSLLEKRYIRQIGEKYDLAHTFNGLYRRLEWDKPSMTVDTRFGNPRFFIHPDENRGFSVREAARIQGFSDDFVFSGTVQQQFKMIGNAVPPPMAFEIARLITENILK